MLIGWIFSIGDEEEVAALQSKADAFDVSKYWTQHSRDFAVGATHNGYINVTSARQLDETVGQFLARLPPATTRVAPDCQWIYIWNPFVPSDRKATGQGDGDTLGGGEMTEEFIVRAQKKLQQYETFVENNRTPTGKISAKIKKEAKVFTGTVLKLAGYLAVTAGKVSMLSHKHSLSSRIS